jgi:predicted Zn-dependent peptidase
MTTAIEKTVLENGVRVLTSAIPHVRSISMGVWVDVGARDEAPAENGLSHFIEHMIFKGTRQRTAYQIAKEFDAIGGLTNAFTTMESTCYHAKVMDRHLDTMIDILSDIFLNSVFAPEEVEKERPVILQEIGMMEDAPEDYVHFLAGESFWSGHALGRSILGSRENILRFDAGAIVDFFHRYYQPERIVISAAGHVDHNRFVERVAPAFESVAPGNGFPLRAVPVGQPRRHLHQRDLEQVHICLLNAGLAVGDPKRYAFALMNTILGGNMSSRLFQEVRERRGLAYSIYSFVSTFADTGAFGAYAGVSRENVHLTVDVIRRELSKLTRQPVEASELADAKEFTKASLYLSSESVDNHMVRMAQNEFHFHREISIPEMVRHIEAVTEDAIVELALELLRGDRLSLTLLGPVSQRLLDDIELSLA